jgi:UDP-N-acetylglucosamine 2-epimerase
VTRPYLLVVFHPTTTEYGGERTQMRALLDALDEIAMPTLLLWPNIDAGADHISKEIRIFRADRTPAWLRTLTNVSPEDYLRVLSHAACAVGNSSSFVRDAGYFGTPVALVGNRQDGRETDEHVTRVAPLTGEIVTCVRRQLAHGRYEPSTLYGDSFASERISNALATLKPYVQKRLDYVYREETSADVEFGAAVVASGD